MIITEAQIRRAAPSTSARRLTEFVTVFNEWHSQFHIDTPRRLVHFLAQCWHESAALRYLEELASGSAYDTGRLAQRLGNTPDKDGDGQRYKGRGMIQITGRANYQAYAESTFCTGDLMAHPEWLAKSPGAYKSAMWFWWRNGLNELADCDDAVRNGEDVVRLITRRVNGGLNGLADRQYYYRKFKREFGL